MTHLPPMINDLAIILAAAAISTLIFSRLKQPIVLGYLIAGFAVGPHFKYVPAITDTEGVKLWAEIGVIFLLFSLGLEFSFKKLAKVGKSATIATTFEMVMVSAIGYILGQAFGWTVMESIYLGAALSISSTTIIIRAFDEAKLKGKAFVNLVFGILIVEDLMAILLIVLLTAISTVGAFSGGSLLYLSARLIFFLLIWFLVGIYILPSLLKKIKNHLTDEIMLIVSIALCFLMVVLSTNAQFSPALGAFIMGSILAETNKGTRIEHLLVPVKNLFAAVFFVSVGMMIDPSILKDHFGIIVAITAVAIFGKFVGSGLGSLISGRSLKQSVQAGMSLAQIGEFSFIIITLGLSLNVISDYVYPVIIAVSAITTFTTPYMIKHSVLVYNFIESKLSRRVLDTLRRYELAMASQNKEGTVGMLWRMYGLSALLNSVVVIAIVLFFGRFLVPLLGSILDNHIVIRTVSAVITLLACSPFIVAIMLDSPKKRSQEEIEALARLKNLQFGILFFKIIVGLTLIALIINQYAAIRFLFIFVSITAFIFMYFLRRFIKPFYYRVENRFLLNFNSKEIEEANLLLKKPELLPWNATLTKFVISADSNAAGHSLEELKFRSHTGATVAMIDRGKRRIFAPNRSERLLPSDEIFLIGTDEQLSAAQSLLEMENPQISTVHDESFRLEFVLIEENSLYRGQTIREIGVGEEFGGLIVGIERGGQRILNPESSVALQAKDLIWVFGHQDRIRDLKRTVEGVEK